MSRWELPTRILPCVALVSLLSCATSCRSVIAKASPCELRDSSERYANKRIQTKGWIYTDEERFGLSNDKCSLGLWMPDLAQSDGGVDRFNTLAKNAKKGGFTTHYEVFAVIEGRFLTEQTTIGKDVWAPGNSGGRLRRCCSYKKLFVQESRR